MSLYEVAGCAGLGGLTSFIAFAPRTALAQCFLYSGEEKVKCLVGAWVRGDISEPTIIMTAMALGGAVSLYTGGLNHYRGGVTLKGLAHLFFGGFAIFAVHKHLDYAAQYCTDASMMFSCYYDLVETILFGSVVAMGAKYTATHIQKEPKKAVLSGLATMWLFYTLVSHGVNFPSKV